MPYTPNNPYIPGDPYSYDLKWMVDQIKYAISLYEPLHDEFTALSDDFDALSDDFTDLKNYVTDYFANLDLTAEVQAIINNMIADDFFYDLVVEVLTNGTDISPAISAAVTQWLNDNIGPTTPAIDKSLQVADAAADAKSTGDHVFPLQQEAAANMDENRLFMIFNKGNIDSSGNITSNNNRCYTQLITLASDEFIIARCDSDMVFNVVRYDVTPVTTTTFINTKYILTNGQYRIVLKWAGAEVAMSSGDAQQHSSFEIFNRKTFLNKTPGILKKATDEIVLHPGNLNNSGVPANSPDRTYTDYITRPLYIESTNGLWFVIKYYNPDDTYVTGDSGWITNGAYIDPNNYSYKIKLVFRNAGSTAITPNTIENFGHIYIAEIPEYSIQNDSDETYSFIPEAQYISSLRTPMVDVDNIPFTAFTPTGRLIIGCDVRQHPGGDTTPIEIYIVYSDDFGATWSAPMKVLSKGNRATNSRVTDGSILVTPTGRILIFGHYCNSDSAWQTMDSITSERPYFDLVYTYSDDNGATWQPQISLQNIYYSDNTIVSLFDGVGAGIVMDNGMLVLPAQAKMASSNTSSYGTIFKIQSGLIYSSDDGATWQMGPLVPSYTSECNIIEISPNKLLINCRGYISERKLFTCEWDGAAFTDWIPFVPDSKLVEPTACQGTFYKWKLGFRKVGLFLNPDSDSNRGHLVLKGTKDYSHYYRIMCIRDEVDATYGYSGLASWKNRLFAVYAKDGWIYYTDLSDYAPIIWAL